MNEDLINPVAKACQQCQTSELGCEQAPRGKESLEKRSMNGEIKPQASSGSCTPHAYFPLSSPFLLPRCFFNTDLNGFNKSIALSELLYDTTGRTRTQDNKSPFFFPRTGEKKKVGLEEIGSSSSRH